ncbi:chymotrypsin-like elastase family member 1 [Uranotaenia lowii]|uniref:chymotrypsin-like elastase family member 1 n=1 Tax=Uranotaenia lowii TaxID=190385 RepID=UPI002479F48E|nr:chymotrypsin-like elastase family member 1 [Uranotaenia lowii]
MLIVVVLIALTRCGGLQIAQAANDDDDEFMANNALYRCGIQKRFGEQLIQQGWTAEMGQWPWHVALYHQEKGKWAYKCGGTLIDQRHVLTSAHCAVQRNGRALSETKIRVELGKHDLYENMGQEVQVRNVSEVLVHPEFSLNRNDIAMLVLNRNVRYSDSVAPICLEDARKGLLANLEGERGWVAGWGITENETLSTKLKTVEMPVVSSALCSQSDPVLFGRFIFPGSYCASDRNGSTVCLGDSGGGMYFSAGDHFELRGIVSFAAKTRDGKCLPEKFVVFTNVAYYYGWISRSTFAEIEEYDNLQRRVSERKCSEYAKLARKRKNGVCYNSRSPHTQYPGDISGDMLMGHLVACPVLAGAPIAAAFTRLGKTLSSVVVMTGTFQDVP